MSIGNVMGNLFDYTAVTVAFMLLLALIFKISLKKYDVKSSKLKFYGLFLDMDNRSILAFSCITLNYIFLIWCTTSFSGLNIFYALITIIFIFLSDILIKDYKHMFINLFYTIINLFCILVTSVIYDYMNTQYVTLFLMILLGLVIVFILLYYTYITFKLLNNIAQKNKNLQKKDYKNI